MNWNEFNIQPYSTAIFNNRQHPSINQLSTRGRLQRRGLHSFEAAVGCLRHGLRLHLLGAYGWRDLCLRTHVPWRNGTLERLERREAGRRGRGQDLRTMRVASTWMIHTFSIPFLGFWKVCLKLRLKRYILDFDRVERQILRWLFMSTCLQVAPDLRCGRILGLLHCCCGWIHHIFAGEESRFKLHGLGQVFKHFQRSNMTLN